MDDAPSPTQPLFGTPREWAKDLATATVLGVFLGVIGPFGSFYGAGMETRIAYWVANMWIGFIIISLTARLSIKAALRLDAPIWFALAVGVAIGALPLGFLIQWFSALYWPGNHGRFGDFGVWYGQTLVVSEPFSFAFYYFRVQGGAGGAWRLAGHGSADGAPTPPSVALALSPDPPERRTIFLDRLPPRLGRDLLCLQMEDHYVRAHTAKTSDLVLIPLKDAIAELGDTPGMQVHRSWWVAKSAVAEPVANGRNLSLRLINGLQVPVSRASVAKLKLAGWLD